MIGHQISIHNLPKQITYLIFLIVLILLIGTAGFSIAENESLTGAFVYTIQSLAFQYEGTNLISKALNTFLGAVGVIIIWFSIWTAFGLAVEGKFAEYFKEAKMKNQIGSMKDHYIVCGAGRVGKHVGHRLRQRGEKVVFIEKDKDVVDKLVAENFPVLDVGPIDEHILLQAGIKHAKGIVACLGDDSKNLLLVLTAKEIHPGIKIAARINDFRILQKFKRAGANLIIIPEAIGGVKLADALLGNLSSDVIVAE